MLPEWTKTACIALPFLIVFGVVVLYAAMRRKAKG